MTVSCKKISVRPDTSIVCTSVQPRSSLRIPVPEKEHDFIAKLGLRLKLCTWGKVSFLILFPEDTAECDFLASTVTSQFETDAVFH